MLKPQSSSICFQRCTRSCNSCVTSFNAVLENKLQNLTSYHNIWHNRMPQRIWNKNDVMAQRTPHSCLIWLWVNKKPTKVRKNYLASTMLRSTSSMDLPCVETNAPTRLDRFFLSFSHCNKKKMKRKLITLPHILYTMITVRFEIRYKWLARTDCISGLLQLFFSRNFLLYVRFIFNFMS